MKSKEPVAPNDVKHTDEVTPKRHEQFAMASTVVSEWARVRPGRDATLFEIAVGITLIQQQLATEFRTFAQNKLDMGSGDFQIMLALRRSGPDCAQTPVWLKRNLFVTASAVTKQISRLESRGLVRRSSYKGSKRDFLIHLTEKGIALVDQALQQQVLPIFEEALYSLEAKEQEYGHRFLRRLIGALETVRNKA